MRSSNEMALAYTGVIVIALLLAGGLIYWIISWFVDPEWWVILLPLAAGALYVGAIIAYSYYRDWRDGYL